MYLDDLMFIVPTSSPNFGNAILAAVLIFYLLCNMNFQNFKLEVESLANSPTTNLVDIEQLISQYFNNLGVMEHESANMYVVRASKNGSHEIFKDEFRCSYNPMTSDIPLQRCNYPEQQLFYCSMFTQTAESNTSITCILETALEQVKDHKITKAYYTLSRWNLKRPLRLAILPFSKLSHKKNADFKIMSASTRESLKKHVYRKEILAAHTYMSEVFCRRRKKNIYYKISAAYFNYIMKLSFNFDGLAYPSANTDASGINVALRKSIIDEGILVFYCAIVHRLRRDGTNKKNLSVFPCSDFAFPNPKGLFTFTFDEEAKTDLVF
ncbi:MAG: hypothetical protein H7334_10905 [Ferruginibacter sp.]|nr:hypothetical protein [Ferruginibacter sp.]